jgi:hypothetical protein
LLSEENKVTTGRVRAFTEGDVPEVAALHRRVFGLSDQYRPELHSRYFYEVFLNNPWCDRKVCSLVYEERGSKIGGFLGVVPRPMRIGGRSIRAAVSSQFVVDSASRSKFAGVLLLQAFLSGPQDLSLADEANDASRAIWERLGGSTAVLYSIHWTFALHPARFLQLRIARRPGWKRWAFMLTPISRAIETVAAGTLQSTISTATISLEEGLSVESLLMCCDSLWHSDSLRPIYDRYSLEWLLGRSGDGHALQGAAVRKGTQEIIGWFLYYLDLGGVAEVVQIGSQKGSARLVLDELFRHAQRQGAVALRGRMEAGFMPEILACPRLSYGRRFWTLIHSSKPEVLDTIRRGEAFLTRLEGEWCLRFDRG